MLILKPSPHLPMNDKVLVVDDENLILKGINLNLGRKFNLTTANSPEDAFREVEENGPFAVIVSDMRMPGMDGASMMRKIKEKNPSTLCILLTGHADFEFGGSQALQSGQLFKILSKPCSPDVLKTCIQAALNASGRNEKEGEETPDFIL